MERPLCQFGGVGGCLRPATWLVCFAHDSRSRFSCFDHRDQWNKHGETLCWLAELKGYLPDHGYQRSCNDCEAIAEYLPGFRQALRQRGPCAEAAGLRDEGFDADPTL